MSLAGSLITLAIYGALLVTAACMLARSAARHWPDREGDGAQRFNRAGSGHEAPGSVEVRTNDIAHRGSSK